MQYISVVVTVSEPQMNKDTQLSSDDATRLFESSCENRQVKGRKSKWRSKLESLMNVCSKCVHYGPTKCIIFIL
jgi:hypothetical protein